MRLSFSLSAFAWLGCQLVMSATPKPPRAIVRFGSGTGLLGGSEAVRIESEGLALTAQMLPTDSSGALDGEGSADTRVGLALANLGHALRAAGSSMVDEIRPEFYAPERPPAASKASVRGTAAREERWRCT